MQSETSSPRLAGSFLFRRVPAPARKTATAREDLRGKTVQLEAIDGDGERVKVEMDAADAWKDTQQRLEVFRNLKTCLQGDGE